MGLLRDQFAGQEVGANVADGVNSSEPAGELMPHEGGSEVDGVEGAVATAGAGFGF